MGGGWFWVRLVQYAVAGAGAMIALAVAAWPGIRVPWGQAGFAVAMIPVFFVVVVGATVVMPRTITVRRGSIDVADGNVSVRIRGEEIAEIRFDQECEPLALIVRHAQRGKTLRERRFVIGKKVDAAMLEEYVRELRGFTARSIAAEMDESRT